MMVYIGPLFGRVSGKYFPLLQTSEDVDKITAQRDELLAALTHAATDYIDQNGMVPSWWTEKIRKMVKDNTHA